MGNRRTWRAYSLEVAGNVTHVVSIGAITAGGCRTAIAAIITDSVLDGVVDHAGSADPVHFLDAGPDGADLAESAHHHVVGEATGAD
jgi:hypothetical protein